MLGLDVPGDVSVTGWDDLPIAAWDIVQLTTVGQSMDEMARTAARLLVERIEGRAGSGVRRILFEPRIVSRATLGPRSGEVDQDRIST
jgi:LacI family transcriptional regulator